MRTNSSITKNHSTVDKTSHPCQINTRGKKMSPMKMKVTRVEQNNDFVHLTEIK